MALGAVGSEHGPRSTSGALLGDGTRLGLVDLTVRDLERSIAWYERSLGLHVATRDDGRATLRAGGEDLIVLHEDPAARPPGREAGLYHYALLFPERVDLARVLQRLAVTRTPIQGASDHGTHEAIYLPDADGIGIELAWDRAREQWPNLAGPGGYGAGPAPLDLDGLLDLAGGEGADAPAPSGLRMGHVHLHVSELEPATRFYRDGLGFEVMTDLGTAVFVSAGDYHHHVGFNVWRGRGVPPAGPDAVGLRHWTLVVEAADELDAVRARLGALGAPAEAADGGVLARDPSGIAVHMRVDAADTSVPDATA